MGPGERMFKVVSRYSTGMEAIVVPNLASTTIWDVKGEVGRALLLPQHRQELSYNGMPCEDSWSINDLPKDCDMFFLKVQQEHDWKQTDIVDGDHLPDGERLPHRIMNEMELERQGKWNLIGGAEGVSNDTLHQATVASEKADEFDNAKHEVTFCHAIFIRLNAIPSAVTFDVARNEVCFRDGNARRED